MKHNSITILCKNMREKLHSSLESSLRRADDDTVELDDEMLSTVSGGATGTPSAPSAPSAPGLTGLPGIPRLPGIPGL